MIRLLVLFLVLNFGGLAIGASFTGEGVGSDWYASLNKAPWTPPGWVFGAAWTTIMICFSIFLAKLISSSSEWKSIAGLYAVSWVLNVAWNPVFFAVQYTTAALLIITLLTVVVAIFQFKFYSKMNSLSLLMLPYFIWILIAISLNGYVVFFN